MPSRIANEIHLSTVRPLIGSHYPPEYHSFMYAADFGKLPRSSEKFENYMFYDSSNGVWHCVMPIMLVTRTVIIDSAAITLTGSGFSNDGSLNAMSSGWVNYAWLTTGAGTLYGSNGAGEGGGAISTASATWTAGSKTLTVTSVTGSPAVGATIYFQGATTAQRVARATPNTFGVTAVSVASGSGTFTMSHAPTESGSGSITLYARRPLSQISQILYCNSAGEPYLVYGVDFSTGGELGASGFNVSLPAYDTAADNSLLGSEAGSVLYGDFPESGESWGGASSYPIVNNCCVVDRTGGGNRGQGKALALIWSFNYNNISPAEVRDRLQGVRFLVTIRHRSSLTGGKGG